LELALRLRSDSARTALGSTNSGNTDQLGNKVTTSIKNQAINKTEGLVNDKANTFLNTFGAGRSEVSISGISTKRLTYSLPPLPEAMPAWIKVNCLLLALSSERGWIVLRL
jgi:hypothetical protein